MRLHRFYTKKEIDLGREISVDEADLVNQIRNVFRMGKKDQVILFNGDGLEYVSEIISLNKKEISFKFLEKKSSIIQEKKITLFQALIKKDNFELILQKCTEIGVSNFVPVLCERSEKKNFNIERAEKILKEASEQSGRGDIPKILPLVKFTDLPFDEIPIFTADFGGEETKKINFPNKCGILIGPEGGFSEEERKFLKEKKVKFISLGETVLRAETAAIVASTFSLV